MKASSVYQNDPSAKGRDKATSFKTLDGDTVNISSQAYELLAKGQDDADAVPRRRGRANRARSREE